MKLLSSSSSSSSLSTTMKTKKSTSFLILSTCMASLAVIILQLSQQTATLEFLKNHLTIYWLNLNHKLKPSYLYILINCIILSIVASSKLNACEKTEEKEKEKGSQYHPFVAAAEEVQVEGEMDVVEEVKEVVFGYAAREGKKDDVEAEAVAEKVEKEEEEKVLYSSRFGNRKPVKASPEGKTALKKVTRPKRQETLESTWRTITEGRSMPLKRHLRKSDTITGASQDASPPVHVMKKSDTFSHGGPAESPSPSSSGGKIRREPSLSQDDLNRRVEAFIKKFNEEMRLQRQESFNNYQQVNRQGVY